LSPSGPDAEANIELLDYRPLTPRAVHLVLLVPCILLSACVSEVNVSQQTLWSASLEGSASFPLAVGTAAVVSRDRTAEASISVENPPEGTHTWRVREGNCEAPGDELPGQYEFLPVPTLGDVATGNSLLSVGLASSQLYMVEMRLGETSDVVACGELTRN
jgi:hypothetical protein